MIPDRVRGEVDRDASDDAMSEDDVRSALEGAKAVHRGHFRLTSGRHSDTYVQCARILEDPALTTRLARTAAARVSGLAIDLVVSPAVGGLIIGFAVAQALNVRFIFAERVDGSMCLRRSFQVRPGSRVLIVEDVITTGASVAEVAALVRAAGARVVRVVAIVDRGGDKRFTDPFEVLLALEIESWDPEECELCLSGTPVETPGSRLLA